MASAEEHTGTDPNAPPSEGETLEKRQVIQAAVVQWDFDKYDEDGAGRYYLKPDVLAALDAHLGR